MRVRFLFAGTLIGGILLSLLGWLTAAILRPRFKQFRDANWEGFPLVHLLAVAGYLSANWFVTGLVLGVLRGKLDLSSPQVQPAAE
jgi:hypothetical protein